MSRGRAVDSVDRPREAVHAFSLALLAYACVNPLAARAIPAAWLSGSNQMRLLAALREFDGCDLLLHLECRGDMEVAELASWLADAPPEFVEDGFRLLASRRPKRQPLRPIGALAAWRRSLARGDHKQRLDARSTWVDDDLSKAAMYEVQAFEYERDGLHRAAEEMLEKAVSLLAALADNRGAA